MNTVWQAVGSLKQRVLKKLSEEAQRQNIASVQELSAMAAECDRIERYLQDVEQRLDAESENAAEAETKRDPSQDMGRSTLKVRRETLQTPSARMSRQQVANEARAAFINRLYGLGIRWRSSGGSIFATPQGRRITIRFATREKKRPDKWWLGVADEPIDGVVLICRDAKGEDLPMVLIGDDLRKAWPLLSRDSMGQVKFHVQQVNSSYFLNVPTTFPIELTGSVNNFERLKTL